jgi:hypothetical protein
MNNHVWKCPQCGDLFLRTNELQLTRTIQEHTQFHKMENASYTMLHHGPLRLIFTKQDFEFLQSCGIQVN